MIYHVAEGNEAAVEAVGGRIRRGLDHFDDFGAGIIRLAEDFYRVPSESHPGLFRSVHLDEGDERCTCPDYRAHGRRYRLCRHIVAALVAGAKHRSREARDDLEMHYSCLEMMPGTAVLTMAKSHRAQGARNV